tara:strand:- start:1315 stop:1641 length:327 start_codon:yes stop_codon:yes gene_type:complete
MANLYRSNCFQDVNLDLKQFRKIESIEDLYLGCEVYWKYGARIVLKGNITNETEGYISDFITLVKRGVIYVKKELHTEEFKEKVKEELEVKKVETVKPTNSGEQMTLF